jgi:nicotinate-nucleotide adenylyltransferase
MINTGLLFGSFNPIHIGHVAIAGYMKEFAGMEEIWFIVSPQNPHKSKDQLATPATRLNMVRLALENFPSFKVSEIEFGMPVPSYTLDTMKKLSMLYENRDFHLIIGTDNIESISKWKGSDILLKKYKFLIYPRIFSESPDKPGKSKIHLHGTESGQNIFSNVKFTDAPLIEISSSFVRNAIKEGKDMQAFVPPGAYGYLVKNRLYK